MSQPNVFNKNVLVSGSLEATTLTDGTASLTSGAWSTVTSVGCESVTASMIVEGLELSDGIASLTLGALSGVTTIDCASIIATGNINADNFTGDGSALTGITVPNIVNASDRTISNDGVTNTATSFLIGGAGQLFVQMNTGDDATSVFTIANGNITDHSDQGTTSGTQLICQEGMTYYEIAYYAPWGTETDDIACKMTEIKIV